MVLSAVPLRKWPRAANKPRTKERTQGTNFPLAAAKPVKPEVHNREDLMPAERFDFANADGNKLASLLDNPPGTPRAYALFVHCFTCGKDFHAARRVAESLKALGIAVLRFDFTGLNMSLIPVKLPNMLWKQ